MELNKKFVIKQHDDFPPLIIQALGDDGKPLDLTGYHAIVIIAEEIGARPIVHRDGTVLPLDGKIQLNWLPGETKKPGKYLLEVILEKEIEPGKITQFTLPSVGYAEVIITPRLVDSPTGR